MIRLLTGNEAPISIDFRKHMLPVADIGMPCRIVIVETELSHEPIKPEWEAAACVVYIVGTYQTVSQSEFAKRLTAIAPIASGPNAWYNHVSFAIKRAIEYRKEVANV